MFAAMQGAARMVLQTGIHPAALKDSVTSMSLPRFFSLTVVLGEG